MINTFIPSVAAASSQSPAWLFVFNKEGLLVVDTGEGFFEVPPRTESIFGALSAGIQRSIGTINGVQCLAMPLPDGGEIPPNMVFLSLRKLFYHMDNTFFTAALRALSIVNWERCHKFCGQCGTATSVRDDIMAMECNNCGSLIFPRLSPAVIVLVEHNGKMLLARAGRFQEDMYSVLAGFVEPGETLEEAVKREVHEETGIDVKNIRYFGSQPWPFPDSLMIAFTAEYAGGKIAIDMREILHAAWFDAECPPSIPGHISIARALIDWFIRKESAKKQ